MKNITLIALSLVTLVCAASVIVIAFSTQDDDRIEDQINREPLFPLNSEKEIEIKQDYLDFYTKTGNPDATVDDVSNLAYYGTYGDCIVIKMTDRFSAYYAAITTETIDGIKISTNDSNPIRVWKDGNFFRLQEAYDWGFLTKDNLREVANRSQIIST